LGGYLYARRTGASIAGAAVTSLVWQWSGFLVGQIGHTNIVQTAALLPWLLWAIDGYGTTGKRSRGVLIALLVAAALFAGHQQAFAYVLLVAVPYAVVMWKTNQAARSFYLWSLVFIAAGLALGAVQILPTAELLRNSLRADATYDFFTSFSMPRRFILTFLAPYLMGGGDGTLFRAPYVGPSFYAEYNGYVGLLTIALGMVAFTAKREAQTIFWFVVVFAGILLALGRYAPLGLYHLIYYVPGLNLFRVPARHLMEVQFALAVLAGRGLTVLGRVRDETGTLRWVGAIGAGLLLVTWCTVTFGRPANFTLGRVAPLSLLRAPELFLPVVFAAASGLAIWIYARGKPGAALFLFLVLSADLVVWGQSSGWRVGSPKSDFELWTEPETVRFLRNRERGEKGERYRIFTQDKFFDPAVPPSNAASGGAWVPSLQPDVYMMFGLENAAGYEGFGLARYSRLAGDMKVWGELTDPERTLRTASRELDLLNVRYLLARSSEEAIDRPPTAAAAFLPASHFYGGQPFGDEDILKSALSPGDRLSFKIPPIAAEHLALLTTLAWAETVPDRAVVARVRLLAVDGRNFDFELRAGDHTSEWSHDRPDIRARIKHQRAPIGLSYAVKDAQGDFEAHAYVATLALPERVAIKGGEIRVLPVAGADRLALNISRLTLVDGEKAFPLRSNWAQKMTETGAAPAAVPDARDEPSARWKRLAVIGDVAVYENNRTLPRAWLAGSELVVPAEEQLRIIRSGKEADDRPWNPLETVLTESASGLPFQAAGESRVPATALINRYEPNRLEIKTTSTAPAVLVLSENHYPGWRATVDGRPVPILRVNYNQRGVALAAGNHDVAFVYRPRSVIAGASISAFTLALLLLWMGRWPDRVYFRLRAPR
jgi:hypothetical protein